MITFISIVCFDFLLFVKMSVPSVKRTVMTAQAGHWWSGVGPMDVSQSRPYLPPSTGPTAGDGTSVHHGSGAKSSVPEK